MSLYLQQLSDLERFLSLTQSANKEEWAACLAHLRELPACQEGGAAELLELLQGLGPAHLEAIREFKRTEQNKGCIPAYFRDLCPI